MEDGAGPRDSPGRRREERAADAGPTTSPVVAPAGGSFAVPRSGDAVGDASRSAAGKGASPSAEPPADLKPSPAQEDWTGPRRIALLVSFALSLALFFGTAAALLSIPGTLPLAAWLALLSGLLEVPAVVLFAAGVQRRLVVFAPSLLVASGGGFASYFVGGAVGVGSPTTLGAGVLALVVYFYVGHRAPESRRRRARRLRRWSRNAVVAGVALLLIAVALYAVYSGAPSLGPVAGVELQQSTPPLLPGENDSAASITGAPGDELYLLVGTSNTTAGVVGSLLNSAGEAVANVTAGTYSTPQVVFLPLRTISGTYTVRLLYPVPTSANYPSSVVVKWSVGDIPAVVVATGAAAVPSGWAGFVLLIVGATTWIVSRPPPEPASTRNSEERPGAESDQAGEREPVSPEPASSTVTGPPLEDGDAPAKDGGDPGEPLPSTRVPTEDLAPAAEDSRSGMSGEKGASP